MSFQCLNRDVNCKALLLPPSSPFLSSKRKTEYRHWKHPDSQRDVILSSFEHIGKKHYFKWLVGPKESTITNGKQSQMSPFEAFIDTLTPLAIPRAGS